MPAKRRLDSIAPRRFLGGVLVQSGCQNTRARSDTRSNMPISGPASLNSARGRENILRINDLLDLVRSEGALICNNFNELRWQTDV